MSDDEYDQIPDDFADVDGIDWAQLLSAPQRTHSPPPNAREYEIAGASGASTPTSAYFDDDVFDENALAEIDAIELQATEPAGSSRQGLSRDSTLGITSGRSSSRVADLHEHAGSYGISDPGATTLALEARPLPGALKRDRSISPSQSSKKGKMKVNESNKDSSSATLALLAKMEDEYSCPVCFDLVAAAHIANPCGHSFCGECGQQWLNNAVRPTCPVCRTDLSKTKTIPNVALENSVEKYIEIMGLAGHKGWLVGGTLYEERARRKERWKTKYWRIDLILYKHG